MKKLLILAAAFICSCSAPKQIIKVDPEVTAAQVKVPGITAEQLASGKKLYLQNCSSCHFLKDPALYTPVQWHQILPVMLVRAKISDEGQKTLITDYVIAKSK